MRFLLCAVVVAVLAGCGSGDSASYMIGGNRDHSLSLFREKAWYWSDWEVSLVVTRQPDCMRRHRLAKSSAGGKFKIELYDAGSAYIVHQGSRWYVAETQKCQLQAYDAPPPHPGELVGNWIDKDGVLTFSAVPAETP